MSARVWAGPRTVIQGGTGEWLKVALPACLVEKVQPLASHIPTPGEAPALKWAFWSLGLPSSGETLEPFPAPQASLACSSGSVPGGQCWHAGKQSLLYLRLVR